MNEHGEWLRSDAAYQARDGRMSLTAGTRRGDYDALGHRDRQPPFDVVTDIILPGAPLCRVTPVAALRWSRERLVLQDARLGGFAEPELWNLDISSPQFAVRPTAFFMYV